MIFKGVNLSFAFMSHQYSSTKLSLFKAQLSGPHEVMPPQLLLTDSTVLGTHPWNSLALCSLFLRLFPKPGP